ncbi:unnamed protein product, partial [Ixodes hexagonus]
MSLASRKAPYLQMIDNVPRSPFLKPEVYREATRFQPTANDVILISHPKLGTHWVTQIVLLLLSKGQSPGDLADLVKQAPFIEANGVPVSDRSPRFLRTHFPFGQLKLERSAKYIYLARNPWDTCVSFYHHVKQAPAFRFQDGSFEEFVDAFLKSRVGHVGHLDHVLSGYAQRDEPNVFFLTYEKLKEDTARSILDLARFIGEPCASMLDKDTGLMDEIIFKSSVDYMKGKFEVSPEEIQVIFNNAPLPPDAEAKNTKDQLVKHGIVRKGGVGDWIHHFTPELLRRMQSWIDDKTRRSDIMKLWKSQSEAARLAS